MRLSEPLIDYLLLSGRAGHRLIGETPIQPEVWRAFAYAGRDEPVDLLLAPMDILPAADLSRSLLDGLLSPESDRPRSKFAYGVMPLEGFVAVRVNIHEFARVILPEAGMDVRRLTDDLIDLARSSEPGARTSTEVLFAPSFPLEDATFADRRALTLDDVGRLAEEHIGSLSPQHRAMLLVLLLVAEGDGLERPRPFWLADLSRLRSDGKLPRQPDIASWVRLASPGDDRRIWQVSSNRHVEALGVSVETIKADAARRVFDMSCRDITWAVIDSGNDGSHPAFRDHAKKGFATRIDKALDFSRLRWLASYDSLESFSDNEPWRQTINEIAARAKLTTDEVYDALVVLSDDARLGRPYDWGVLSKLLECDVDQLEPRSDSDRPVGHGTHVAGVLGGDWREKDRIVLQGVCPDIRIYDLRVLGDTAEDTEFAVIAALEYVRWLNGRNRYLKIHGVNLSIGIQQDAQNFACGQTPVCRAADAVVRAGVVVVAAAGNWGSHEFGTRGGFYGGYSSISIADPGNTETVITVGATHRERPHEYGVSFFSSRGPTGDGRAKPDLVAPGEKIDGPLPNLGMGRLDGTSMAAPHVSGVAALLLARNSEFIGKPLQVKKILMQSATDLGRERHFQGVGLVDALRALQSV